MTLLRSSMEPPAALTALARRATRLLGQAIGDGLEADVREAYVFLMSHSLALAPEQGQPAQPATRLDGPRIGV